MSPPKEPVNRWAVAMQALKQPWVEAVTENCDIDCYSFANGGGEETDDGGGG